MPTISGPSNIDIAKLTPSPGDYLLGVHAEKSRSGALRHLSFLEQGNRFSFNPAASGGIAGLLFRALRSVGLMSKPVTVPKEAYPPKYQEVNYKDGLSYRTTIPGYKNLDDLKKSVKIAGLASGGSLAKTDFPAMQEELSPEGMKHVNNSREKLKTELSELGLKRLDSSSNLWQKLPPNLKKALSEDGAIRDTKTGLVALVVVSQDEKELHVVFGGTDAGTDDVVRDKKMSDQQGSENVKTIGAFHSHVPESYRQAAELVGALKKVAADNNLGMDVSGFSKGGGEAAFAGIYHGVKTLSHCGTPLSPACQRMLGPEKIKEAVDKKLIFNTSVEGDVVSGSKLFNGIATAWEKLTGLQVARRIGPGLRIVDVPFEKSGAEKMLDKLGIGSFKVHIGSFAAYRNLEMNPKTKPVDPVIKRNYGGSGAFALFEEVLGEEKLKGLKGLKKELLAPATIRQWKVTIETDKTNPERTKSRLVVDLGAVQLDSGLKEQVAALEKELSEGWKSNKLAERSVTVLAPAWKETETDNKGPEGTRDALLDALSTFQPGKPLQKEGETS